MHQILESQQTPHNSPVRASYGVSFVRILKKIYRVITAQHCNHHMFILWPHNERDGVSNHWHPDHLLNHLVRRGSKQTSKLRITGLCEGNPLVTGGFPVTQKMSSFDDVIMVMRFGSIACSYFVGHQACLCIIQSAQPRHQYLPPAIAWQSSRKLPNETKLGKRKQNRTK